MVPPELIAIKKIIYRTKEFNETKTRNLCKYYYYFLSTQLKFNSHGSVTTAICIQYSAAIIVQDHLSVAIIRAINIGHELQIIRTINKYCNLPYRPRDNTTATTRATTVTIT